MIYKESMYAVHSRLTGLQVLVGWMGRGGHTATKPQSYGKLLVMLRYIVNIDILVR